MAWGDELNTVFHAANRPATSGCFVKRFVGFGAMAFAESELLGSRQAHPFRKTLVFKKTSIPSTDVPGRVEKPNFNASPPSTSKGSPR
jgi:hypothetical protein